jgi:hypothetical protein
MMAQTSNECGRGDTVTKRAFNVFQLSGAMSAGIRKLHAAVVSESRLLIVMVAKVGYWS